MGGVSGAGGLTPVDIRRSHRSQVADRRARPTRPLPADHSPLFCQHQHRQLSLWAERQVGPAEPPEKAQEERDAKRAADRIKFSEICRIFKWDDGDFERAKTFGFPNARGRVVARMSWMREALEAVAASMR